MTKAIIQFFRETFLQQRIERKKNNEIVEKKEERTWKNVVHVKQA